MSSVEYRVRWVRDGRRASTRIYQTPEAAHAKARRVLAADRIKDEVAHLDGMPPLIEGPVIEHRIVGPWTTAEVQPSDPTDAEVERMYSYFTNDDGGGVF